MASTAPNDPVWLGFGREVCGDLNAITSREWLVTNGIGGYACGTVAGLLSRRYHGLLVAALQPPVRRVLMLSKLEEIASYDGEIFPLFANHWSDGSIKPTGYRSLDRFHLEGTVPVWTFSIADARLEKRIWMIPGENTTCIRYDLVRAARTLELSLKVIATYRDHHGNTRAEEDSIESASVDHGLRVAARDGVPYYVLSQGAEGVPQSTWYLDFFLQEELNRGLASLTDNLYAGMLVTALKPGESIMVVVSTRPDPELDPDRALEARTAHEALLLKSAPESLIAIPYMRQLVLAADQFIVRRGEEGKQGYSVIAGYPWFGDWGRDTMIALPGLTLETGRPDIAASILRTFAPHIEDGLLPNFFPEEGRQPAYNTVDAALWYIEAVRATYAVTAERALLADLYPAVSAIVDAYTKGTQYAIHVDPEDGLLFAGEPGSQLTWMDARVRDQAVTPRIGKPVEINALWYNALMSMAEFAQVLGHDPIPFETAARRVRMSFERFWNSRVSFCYDVIDGPQGADASMRPNQLFAVALHHSPLDSQRARALVDVCARHLLTPHGLRSLDPEHPDFHPTYKGDPQQRDRAYHQGTVWAWLIGPFVAAHLRVYKDPALARTFLEPLLHHLAGACVGSVSEIFDATSPFAPRGAFAQAWSVAELLRAWRLANGT